MEFREGDVVNYRVRGLFDQVLKPPTAFSLVSRFKSLTIPILRTTPLKDSLEPQLKGRFDGHGLVRIAPPCGENGVFSGTAKAVDEHQSMIV